MPLSAADLAVIGETPITIRSTAFSNVYLRLDGRGVTSETENGGGLVNCQFSVGTPGPYERFKIRPQADGTFSVESAVFPNVWLRMDSRGVTAQTPNGGGLVNARFNANGGPAEKFRLHPHAGDAFSFESTLTSNVFLRMNGTGVTTATDNGGGLVNCQFNANGGIHEKFVISMIDQRLEFAMQRQEQGMWCWSAATVSLAAYYDPSTHWTQCTLANAELNRNDCCVPAGSESPGNQGRWPDTALQRVGVLRRRENRALTPAEIGAEMAGSTPIGLNTSWRGGGGHILAIRGRFFLDGEEYVSVADPWYGDSDVSYNTFRNAYQGSGTWNVSYKTQR
ncbi:papain-like cysteine protease family protein [Solwaraspora sp. WMMA2056]|uniref:fascin domain-containing protein n=1 Tax=Solwaraspora sp. WMMA2056 TaxID=3015161 RepID=UPI00259B1F1D|nr:papain-like cysteine protease family protein [Solwaraspora sp. WMMA2056]WJK38134.1 papain-like cysteine protease family protein [Solwaraspora sp. WMMA2056]